VTSSPHPLHKPIFAEGVGKSSLISTYVSRHFSERIPKLLTRVHLPPDPLLSDCTATIVDTHNGDTALQNALSLSSDKSGESSVTTPASNESPLSSSTPSPSSSFDDKQSAESFLASTVFRNVDAMVLVYDLSREETFNRLEDYWLPLIERCYRGNIPVIIAGNKMESLEQQQQQPTAARSRQQIISLLQRFKFVRQCIKCSAKNLLHVDDVFNKAKVAVMYPIKPLYDLVGGRLTPACSRAFTRIFRMFDLDRDGLLSDDELMAFQNKIWGATLIGRDVIEWKKALAHHDMIIHRREEASVESDPRSEDVMVNDKITLTGFLTIIDIFISQNRLEVPWIVLWTLGYDDELNLHIPESILSPECDDLDAINFDPSAWRLNASEVDFLSSIFYQFQSDGGAMLSSEDLNSIFSVFPIPLPPWSVRSKQLLKGCFSIPRIDEDVTPPTSLVAGVTFDPEIEEHNITSADPSPSSPSISPSGVTISSSPLPSIDVSKSSELDFTMHAIKPLTYLSWLNHWHMFCTLSPSRCRAELFSLGHVGDIRARSKDLHAAPTVSPSTIPDGGTKTIFIRALVLGSNDQTKRSIINNLHGIHHDYAVSSSSQPETSCSVVKVMLPNNMNKSMQNETETVVHLIVTEVPSSYYLASSASEKKLLRKKFSALLEKQNAIGDRVYDVAMLVFDTGDEQSWGYAKDIESNLLTGNMPRIFVGTRENQHDSSSPSVCEYQNHCKSMDLEEPIGVSLDETMVDSPLLHHLVRCTQDASFRSIPHGERKKRLAAIKRKCLWFGSVVSVSLVVVFVFKETKKVERGSWRHFFHRLLPFN